MATGFVARRFGWMAICSVAGILAAVAFVQGQAAKEAISVLRSPGQLGEPIAWFFVFWASVLVLLLSAVQLLRN